jgi:hypothetical protein
MKIGAYTFDVPPPPAMRTFALQQRIAPVAGRIIGVFMQLAGKVDLKDLGEKDVTDALPLAAPALGEVFAAMPAGELEFLTRTLLENATVSGWPTPASKAVALFGGPVDAFDAAFQGRTLDVWLLLWHALRVWYPDFFARAAALRGGDRKESGLKESIT